MLYATPGELATYLDPDNPASEPPANATILIRAASALVGDAIAGAIYPVDDDDYPTEVRVARALSQATCEQASAWHLAGIDPRKGIGQGGPVIASKSLDGASVSYVANNAAAQARSDLEAGNVLTSAAWRILDNAGLLTSAVVTTGNRGGDNYVMTRPYDPTTGRFL